MTSYSWSPFLRRIRCRIALCALASAQLPAPRPFSGPFGQARPRAAIGRAAGVRHARRNLPTRESCSLRKASVGPCNAAGPLPGFPRSAPMQGLLARLAGRYARDAARGAGFAKARTRGIPTELPAESRCRPEFCGDAARAARSGASWATAPRRFERACGRWGSKGRRRGALPLAASAGSNPPRRLLLPPRWGHGRRPDNVNAQGGPFSAGWWDGALGMLGT